MKSNLKTQRKFDSWRSALFFPGKDKLMKKAQPTIRDIALKLNVSISTVSRALRGMADVNQETKRAVLKVAKELEYEPNLIAQHLRTNKTNTLGIIIPDLESHFFSANISGMQKVAARMDYNAMICLSNESMKTEIKNVHTLVASRVDGLLISLSRETTNYDHLHRLYEKRIPLVFFDRVCEEINTTMITVDDQDGAFKAVEHLILQGYRRIAHLSGPEKLIISQNRLKGYLAALQKYNIQPEESLIRHSDLSEENVIIHTNALLDMPAPPDAVFAINDPVAIQAMLVVKERGIPIPEKLAFVGFNNDPTSAIIEPSLTTVAQPAFLIGELAAKHLLDQIHYPDSSVPQTVILKTALIVRNSSLKK